MRFVVYIYIYIHTIGYDYIFRRFVVYDKPKITLILIDNHIYITYRSVNCVLFLIISFLVV